MARAIDAWLERALLGGGVADHGALLRTHRDDGWTAGHGLIVASKQDRSGLSTIMPTQAGSSLRRRPVLGWI